MGRRSMRGEIVEAALEQFHTRGFNAAGVKDITDLAGVPKGSFYNHFASKEALAVVALQEYGATRRLDELTDPAVDPILRLRRHFEFLRDEITSYGYARGCLIGDFGVEVADHSELIRDAVRLSLDTWATALTAALTDAHAAGRIPPALAALDAPTLARFLLSAWEGTLISVRAEQSADAFASFFTTVFDTLLAPSPAGSAAVTSSA
jgi:TetR/AcrR family transcriptional repressor of nem operon